MAANAGRARRVLRTANHRAVELARDAHLDQWLKRRGIVGSRIDTRALTCLIRQNGMPTP